MEQNPTFDAVRALVQQGDTDQALRVLITMLEKEGRQPEALRTLRVVEANYNTVRQEERKGILAFSEAQRTYARANDTVLAVVEAVETGRTFKDTTVAPVAGRSISRYTWLVGGLALLLLAGVGAWFWASKSPDCPDWQENAPRVLLLPFQNAGENASKPELLIQTRIQELSGKNNFPLSVKVQTNFDAADKNPDHFDASALGRQCGADLVVWGLYVQQGDSLKVDARFAFIRSGDGGSTGFKSFSDITGIVSGRMFKTLDDAVFSLCALMAVREQNMPLAKKWLGKIKTPDARDRQVLERIDDLAAKRQ